MLWKKKPRVGVDLGKYSLKLCALETSETSCTVCSEEIWPQRQARESPANQHLTDEQVKRVFDQGLKRFKSGAKRLHIGITDPGMCSGYLELPSLSKDQLAVAVPSAVAREIPQNLKDVQLFYIAIPPLDPNSGKGALFFVTLPKQAIETQQSRFSKFGHEIAQLEPGLLALVRGLNRNRATLENEPQLVAEIGFSTTTLLLMRQGYPYYSREFAMGGGDFTYAIQMAEQLSWAEAEAMKRKHNVMQGDFKQEPYLLRWETEMKRSLQFLRNRWPMLTPTSALLTGGGALWAGLPERLEHLLEVPVALHSWQKVQPSSNLQSESSPALYAKALGLVTKP